MELHSACVGEQSSNEERLQATQINMAVAQRRLEGMDEAVRSAKDAVDTYAKQMDLAAEAFKKASDSFPTGWDIIGQEVVSALAETATTALGQLMNGLTANMNPMARIQAGTDMFKSLIYKKDIEQGKEPPKVQPPPAPKDTAPKDSTSPAYAEVKTDIIYLGVLNAILTKGKDGGIDWEMAAGADGNSDQSALYALDLLEDAQTRFSKVASEDEPSRKLQKVLETAIEVAKGVQAEVEKSKDTSHKFPVNDSPVVKNWRDSFAEAWNTANTLYAVARSVPGNSATRAPLMSTTEQDPAVLIAKENARSARAQAALEAAKNRLQTTQAHLESTQATYMKASQLLVEQQGKLAEIQAEEEIKEVLRHCIALMVQLKAQITNLCLFFGCLSQTIEAAVDHTVTPFIKWISNATMGDGKKVGCYTLTDLTRTTIYHSAITIRAYFGVFHDIASMWVDLSQDYIMPGVNMVEQLGLHDGNGKDKSDADALRAKVARLEKWSHDSMKSIHDISRQKREEMLDTMQERIDRIKSVIKELPPAPAAKKAIEAGASEVVQATENALEHNSKVSPLNRFGMSMI
ncbi:hypothetical protein VTH06DRAFT_6871 [Thermothelomyces fergusii]